MVVPKATILVVEDEPNLLLGLCDILAISDYTTLQARHGREALDVLAQAGDALPDLNLTCITKPFMNGLQMMKIIRNNPLWKTIPIIVVSAAVGKQEIASQAWELGAKAVIEKPFEADAVLDSVAKWVNSS